MASLTPGYEYDIVSATAGRKKGSGGRWEKIKDKRLKIQETRKKKYLTARLHDRMTCKTCTTCTTA